MYLNVPLSNLLGILKGLLNPRLKLTDNYIITTFEWSATVLRSLIKSKESARSVIYLFNYWSVTIKNQTLTKKGNNNRRRSPFAVYVCVFIFVVIVALHSMIYWFVDSMRVLFSETHCQWRGEVYLKNRTRDTLLSIVLET